jgi:rhodanese-related sulfurtransferase/DNA-binding transcriptional ArsR family regulator
MQKRDFKDKLYGQFGRIGKALSNPHRIEMLDLLAQREWSVEALATEVGLTVANASAHLQVLREARLVESRKDGLYVHYRVSDDVVLDLSRALRRVAETQLAEVDRLVESYMGGRADMEPLGFEELRARMREGSVVLIDVRPREEYAAGHIAGAVSVPYDEVEQRLTELPRDREIVAYCRGPYCVFADQAVEALRDRRRRARRLEAGYPEWKVAGLPVETDERGGSKGPHGS